MTKITPLAPRAPYNDVAVASFMIEKVAILSGSKRARSEVVISNPSSKIKGLFLYPKVVTPRIKNSALSAPGSPERWYEISPAIFPAKAVVKFDEGIFKSDAFTVEMDPMTLFFFCLEKATTCTSSSDSRSSAMITLTVDFPETSTVWV